MQIFTTVSEIQNFLKTQKDKTIGFVPTMGALHEGHLSLVREAQKNCEITVVSIFVNPTQFAPHEDLDKYPRPIETDKELLEKEKIEVLFLPSVEEIYPSNKKRVPLNNITAPQKIQDAKHFKFPLIRGKQGVYCYALDKNNPPTPHSTPLRVPFSRARKKWKFRYSKGDTGSCSIKLPPFSKILEGSTRPAHFAGVVQVVKRFFEIIQPADAFFGQKDFQQTLVIKWLIETFQFKINLHVCPIVREKSGLALSSRNQYLNPAEKKTALVLKQSLDLAKKLIQKGETDVLKVEKAMQANIFKKSSVKLDYAVIRDGNNLSKTEIVNQNNIALIAAKVGKTRLIDNAFFIPA